MTTYSKVLRDCVDDEITVTALRDEDDDYARVRTDGEGTMLYTPKQARKVAKALVRAANVAEGKPAKPPKPPAAVTDGEGDTWHRNPDGTYSCAGCLSEWYTNKSLDYVRDTYGIQGEDNG